MLPAADADIYPLKPLGKRRTNHIDLHFVVFLTF
jgi:hypothetical protein